MLSRLIKYSLPGDVEIQHDREEGDEGRDGPDHHEEDGDGPPGDPGRVLQGILDPDVPVQRYHAEAQYGGRGAHHVTAEVRQVMNGNWPSGGG